MSRVRRPCTAMALWMPRRWSSSAARVSGSGAFVCGNSSLFAGLLASRPYVDAWQPLVSPLPAVLPPSTVLLAAGESHLVAISSDAKIHTMGRASHHRLGQGSDTKNRNELAAIQVLLSQKPSAPGLGALLACGARHNIYAPVPDELWGWGCNRAGQIYPNLGLQIGIDMVRALPTPTRLPPFGAPFVDVACGYDFSVAIGGDATKQLWIWGRLDELLPPSALRPHPTINGVYSVADLAGADMVSVKAGFAHVLVMTRSGQVIGLGANRHAQNGRWDSMLPQAVQLPEAAACIAAGSTHSCAVTQSGSVYAFGSSGDAKLGNNATADSHVPLLVPDIVGASVVRCGVDHTIVVCSTGRAFAFGFAQHGAMGVGSLKQFPTPRPVLVGGKIRDVVCGADFSVQTVLLQ